LKSEEKILIELLRNGSIEAFDKLYNLYSAKLYNFIMKVSDFDIYVSEEIVQRVFIKIWETRTDIDPSKSFNSFIFTIAKNMLINDHNHKMVKYIYENHILEKNTNYCTATEEGIEYSFLIQYIETLIGKLPPACQDVYRLSRLESFSNKEIAKKLNKSESTVEKQLSKANKFISEKIKQHYDKIFIALFILFF